MQKKLDSFFSRYELLIPLFIFMLFLAASLPGIRWGAPALWNPDELIWRVDQALGGYMQFDVTEPDFNYPSLPKQFMYAIGLLTYGTGRSAFAFIVAARMFSCVLGALAGVLIYYLARLAGANKGTSLLSGILYVASGVAAANGRFAHNDLYLQFFTILCIFFVLKYKFTGSMRWLYAAFFSVGLATSSKYTGGSLVLVPVAVYLILNWREIRARWLSMIGHMFLGGLVAYLGYGLGTPRSLIDPVGYFSKVIPGLQKFATYGFNSGTAIGIFGQWSVFESAVGIFLYYFFLLSVIWYMARFILWMVGRAHFETRRAQAVGIFLLTLLIFDLPYMVSINYVERHFIPFVPFLSILGAAWVEDAIQMANQRKWNFVLPTVTTVLVIGLAYSFLRLVSIALLFMNDARIPASEYIAGIRGYQKSIEYTLYPPIIEKSKFMRAHNYPIYFVEWVGDEVPTGGRIEYNQGEAGLLERDTDYFVIDSFTYERFYTSSICDTTPVECDFFMRLQSGEVDSFRLLGAYTYSLPSYLPRVNISTVNPEIYIYERVRE